MKISFILPFKFLTGGVKVVFEYANRLSLLEHEVKIFYPLIPFRFGASWSNIRGTYKQTRAFLANLKQGKAVDWFDLNVKLIRVPWISDRFIDDADVVVATAWPTAYAVNNLAKSKGEKFYLIQHYEIWSGPEQQIDDSYRLPLKKIVISNWLKELMQEKFQQEIEAVINNGVDFSKFYNEHKVLNERKRILILYSPLEWKGFKDGVKAFEKAREKHPSIQLVIFGVKRGPNIPEYAEFHENPSPTKLRELYCTSDIFMSASWSEGCQLPPMEAMACKCAVVATNVGGIPDYAIIGITALVNEPHNIDVMADNLIRLLDDSDELLKISIAGYKHIKNFTWERAVDNLEGVFEKTSTKTEALLV